MTKIAFVVNDEAVEADVEPRTSLADLLRQQFGLTGTHLGCEHGVCGACTILIDGKPSRSCITYAVQADGSDVRTIEGFDDDAAMAALRDAFTTEHALQCGFCTPGMLVTARDIVTRLGDPGEQRVREELAGNLCRCTGYAGIVAAVRKVGERQEEWRAAAPLTPSSRSVLPLLPMSQIASAPPSEASAAPMPEENAGVSAVNLEGAEVVRQSAVIDAPADVVWAFLRDLQAVTGCVPGATLMSSDDRTFSARISVKFGPIRASMTGAGTYRFDDATKSGNLTGSGKDRLTGSVAAGALDFSVHETSPQQTEIRTEITFKIGGLLGQFSRGPLVREFVRATMQQFAANAAAALSSPDGGVALKPSGGFIGRILRGILRRG